MGGVVTGSFQKIIFGPGVQDTVIHCRKIAKTSKHKQSINIVQARRVEQINGRIKNTFYANGEGESAIELQQARTPEEVRM